MHNVFKKQNIFDFGHVFPFSTTLASFLTALLCLNLLGTFINATEHLDKISTKVPSFTQLTVGD